MRKAVQHRAGLAIILGLFLSSFPVFLLIAPPAIYASGGDPTTIATTTEQGATGGSVGNRIWTDFGLTWVIGTDGTNLDCWQSSNGGSTWSAATIVKPGFKWVYDVWFYVNTTTHFIVYAREHTVNNPFADFSVRWGTLTSAGCSGMAWAGTDWNGAEVNITATFHSAANGPNWPYPMLDGAGNLYVALSGVTNNQWSEEVMKCATPINTNCTNSANWSDVYTNTVCASQTASAQQQQLFMLGNGGMSLIWGAGVDSAGTVRCIVSANQGGSTWSTARSSTTLYTHWSVDCVGGVGTSLNTVFCAGRVASASDGNVVTFSFGYQPASWPTETIIAVAHVDGFGGVCTSGYTASPQIIVTFLSSTSKISYMVAQHLGEQFVYQGSIITGESTISTTINGGAADAIGTCFQEANGVVTMDWVAGASSPYNLRYGSFTPDGIGIPNYLGSSSCNDANTGATSKACSITTTTGDTLLVMQSCDMTCGALTVPTASGVTFTQIASTVESPCPAVSGSPLHCVRFTLTNNQGSATAVNMPQHLVVNWNLYNSWLHSTVQNVLWADSSGTVLPAWCETVCTSTSTSSDVWVKLNAAISASGGTMNIFLVMYSTSTNQLSSTGNWGKFPKATGTYGQYDNGAKVFSSYTDFPGTSLPSSWASYGSQTVTVNNGVTITGSVGAWGGVDMTGTNSSTVIGEMFGTKTTFLSSNYNTAFGFGDTGTQSNLATYQSQSAADYFLTDKAGSVTTTTYTGSTSSYVYTVYWSSSAASAFANYTQTGSTISTNIPTVALHLQAQINRQSGSPQVFMQWARTRIAPPSNVMPVVTSGGTEIAAYYTTAAATGSLSITMHWTTSGNMGANIYDVTGASTTSPSSSTGSSATGFSPTVTSYTPNEPGLVIAGADIAAQTSGSTSSGDITAYQIMPGQPQFSTAGYWLTTEQGGFPSGTTNSPFTGSSGIGWVEISISFKETVTIPLKVCLQETGATSGTFTLTAASGTPSPSTIASTAFASCASASYTNIVVVSSTTLTVTVPTDGSNTRYRMNASSASSTTATIVACGVSVGTCANEVVFSYYQVGNVEKITANAQTNFDSGLTALTITGTYAGATSTNICGSGGQYGTIAPDNTHSVAYCGSNTVANSEWTDYGQAINGFTNPLGGAPAGSRWEASGGTTCTFSPTSGGGTNNCNYYKQWSYTLSYAIIDGGSPTAPTLTTTQYGSSYTPVLTASATVYWLDNSATCSTTDPLGGSTTTERWHTTQSCPTATASTTIVFNYYHQYANYLCANPSNPTSWDAVYNIAVTGTQIGSSVTLTTLVTANGGGSVCSALVWADATTSISWPGSLTNGWNSNNFSPTPTSGGNYLIEGYSKGGFSNTGDPPNYGWLLLIPLFMVIMTIIRRAR